MSKFNLKEVLGNLREEYKKIYWPDKVEIYHVTICNSYDSIYSDIYTAF